MKVVLYTVRTKSGQKALISIDWETDRKYWNDKASEIVRLREEIPLGEAERLCRMLEEEWASGMEFPEYAGEMERIKLREGAAVEPRLFEAAGRAAARLAGRSLLREEAQQLLDAELQGSLGVSALAALQLAALLGAVQLAAAVAPDAVAVAVPASAGLRGWAERGLRRARLLWGRGAGGRARVLRCRRCGSADKLRRTDCAACGRQACAYCEACLTMGRSRECELLVIGVPTSGAAFSVINPIAGSVCSAQVSTAGTMFSTPAPADAPLLPARKDTATAPFPTATPTASPAPIIRTAIVPSHSKNIRQHLIKRWGLSPAQSDAAAQALAFLEAPQASKGRSFLLWAVTGAGKTEMIFPLLDSVLTREGRALVATPRRDVVLELAPRLAKAFPDRNIAVLYGGSPDRWREGELTLATTHQLLRFQGAFDLVLIDELDAFPYHNDPILHYAAAKCGKPDGRTVYLSATPPAALQRDASRGRLAYARVPVRYHRHPLPVPARLKLPAVYQVLAKQTIPQRLLQPIRRSVERGAQIFLFVPYVKQVEPMVRLLRNQAKSLGLPSTAIAGTSSPDEERGEKVVSFRDRTIQLLVTTTILERGVTIPRSDVFILDAHNSLFDAASLVQMAGRAGRSGDDPFGVVYYGAPEWTRSQRNSIRQIRTMNAAARRKGYLKAD